MLADATGRLRRLVEDVSLVSRTEEGQLPLDRRHVDLREVVSHALDAARPAADAGGITLQHDLPSTPVGVDADVDRIGQVLANLLSNAIEHTPAGGTITTTVSRELDRAVVEVSDTGTGISPEHLPHVFQRFYRADPARSHTRGSGVGLTISRAIVKQHGGQIGASSAGEGMGATVTIHLPAAPR